MNTADLALDYNGKLMAAEPINISLGMVATRLRQGDPVIAQLEPGDATHYCLLIVPAWADEIRRHLGRYGIRENTAKDYLIVTQLDDAGGQAFYAYAHGMEGADMRHIRNGWTVQLFVWWFTLLWAELKCKGHIA